MGAHRLHAQPGLRSWFGRGLVVEVVLHRGELGFDTGEVVLGVGEGLGVAEWLADALLGLGTLLLGSGEVGAGLL